MGRASVNIVYWPNGRGLSRDAEILKSMLSDLGYSIHFFPLRRFTSETHPKTFRFWHYSQFFFRRCKSFFQKRHRAPLFDFNLFLEDIQPDFFGLGKNQIWIPNLEWITTETSRNSSRVDHIFTKTEIASRWLKKENLTSTYVGFTSLDRYRPEIKKNYHSFLHIQGRSLLKGTRFLLEIWKKNSQWPVLTIVGYKPSNFGSISTNIRFLDPVLSEKDLIQLQNENGIHLCPSETEGFGHCLIEAMSSKAVVLSLDAPPMNEMIQSDRGVLVKAQLQRERKAWAELYSPDLDHLEIKINQLIQASDQEKEKWGNSARDWFLKNKMEATSRWNQIFQRLLQSS